MSCGKNILCVPEIVCVFTSFFFSRIFQPLFNVQCITMTNPIVVLKVRMSTVSHYRSGFVFLLLKLFVDEADTEELSNDEVEEVMDGIEEEQIYEEAAAEIKQAIPSHMERIVEISATALRVLKKMGY